MQLFSLFFISFLAATIFPAQSEILLGALYKYGQYDAVILILVATAGNVLGSCVNWAMGRYIVMLKTKKWFPISEKGLNHATNLYNKYGIWTVLMAWVPFIGDPLTIVAGFMRANFFLFLLLVTIGKGGRYIFLIYILSL